MICKICRNIRFIRRNPGSDYVIYAHQRTKQSFIRSIRNGCHFCTMIWHSIGCTLYLPSSSETDTEDDEFIIVGQASKDHYLKLTLYWREQWVVEHTPGSVLSYETINIRARDGKTGVIKMLLELPDNLNKITGSVPSNPDQTFGNDLPSSPLDVNTGSDENMRLAASWLRDCIENHPACKLSAERNELRKWPNRVIDIHDLQSPCLARITRQPYVTLSYCWGESKQLQTKRSNLADHEKTIPVDKLPQTHRDAMAVAYALGFRYIWIDALCIIQDSEDDKHEEIDKMGSIYQGSSLTIDANCGSNADSGLFIHRDRLWYSPCKLKMAITLRDKVIHEQVYAYPYMEKKYGELYTRAWVLQEEILSERHLIFGKDMMSWCCTTSLASEACAASSEESGSDFAELRRWLFAPHLINSAPDIATGRRSLFDTWYAVVKNFSTRYLTYQSDTLPALEGIAQIMKDGHGYSYLYGLWEQDFQRGLCWKVCHRSQNVRDNPEVLKDWALTAPSWSWASCPTAAITFHEPGESYMKQALHMGIQYSTSASAKQRVLQLTGALKKVGIQILREDSGYVELVDLQTRKKVGYGVLDNLPDQASSHSGSRPPMLRPVSCLLACALFKDRWDLICLMLRPTYSGENEYYRVG